jgi:DNA-binding phage protein
MKKTKVTEWKLIDHLTSNEARVAYMNAVVEELLTMDDPKVMMDFLHDTVTKVMESIAIELVNHSKSDEKGEIRDENKV